MSTMMLRPDILKMIQLAPQPQTKPAQPAADVRGSASRVNASVAVKSARNVRIDLSDERQEEMWRHIGCALSAVSRLLKVEGLIRVRDDVDPESGQVSCVMEVRAKGSPKKLAAAHWEYLRLTHGFWNPAENDVLLLIDPA